MLLPLRWLFYQSAVLPPPPGPIGGTSGYLGRKRKRIRDIQVAKPPQTFKTVMAIAPAKRFEIQARVKKLQEGTPISNDEAIMLILSDL